jgi:uncharacterized protein YciW
MKGLEGISEEKRRGLSSQLCILKPHCIRFSHFKVDVSALEASSKPPVHIVEDDVTASLHSNVRLEAVTTYVDLLVPAGTST